MLHVLLACAERPEPDVDSTVENGDVLVPEVAQEPPEARGAAVHPGVVGDDEHARPDPGARSGVRERPLRRERVAAAVHGWRARRPREVALDVEERRARNVPLEVELVATVGLPELPAAVDELVSHAGPA